MRWLQAYLDNCGGSFSPAVEKRDPALHILSMGVPAFDRAAIARALSDYDEAVTAEHVDALIRVVVSLSAQEIGCQHLARNVHGEPKRVLRWLHVLEEQGWWYTLKSFDAASPEITDHRKGYCTYPAALCTQRGLTTADQVRESRAWGALFETALVAAIRNECSRYDDVELFYWRSSDGTREIDLVILRGNVLYPIEIKSSEAATKKHATHMAHFRARYDDVYDIAPGVVIYAGHEFFAISENVFAVPADYLWR